MTPFKRAPRFRRPLSRHRQNQAEDSHDEASTPTGDPVRPADASLPTIFEGPLPPEQQRPQPLTYHLNRALEDALLEPMATHAHGDRGNVANDSLADLGVDTTIVENCPLCGAGDREVPVFTTTLPSVGDVVDAIAQQNENGPHSVTSMGLATSLLALQAEFIELRRRYNSEVNENRALLLQLRSIVGPNRVLNLNQNANYFIPLRRYHIMNEFEKLAQSRTAMRAARMEALQRQDQGRSSHYETATGNLNLGAEGSGVSFELGTAAGRHLVRGGPRDPLHEYVDEVVGEVTAREDLESSMRKHERNSRGKP
ncbi:hypothetical protein N7493_008201 [Penicillium malachiteum]|uniref:Uncharacterized protein n=1 Tax=Penicillium malachiteum TaxID=1324776 RepID=A0AAD6MTQ4_9EURO|nr:hypothetical protein N7493_008201 [Penicillium malachiteum]